MFYLTSETVVTPVVDHKTLWRMGIFQMDEYLDTKLQGARCDPGTHPFVPSFTVTESGCFGCSFG